MAKKKTNPTPKRFKVDPVPQSATRSLNQLLRQHGIPGGKPEGIYVDPNDAAELDGYFRQGLDLVDIHATRKKIAEASDLVEQQIQTLLEQEKEQSDAIIENSQEQAEEE